MPTRADRREAAARWRKATAFRGGRRTSDHRRVHTPLFLLWLLARAGAGGERQVAFEEVEGDVAALLAAFGPPRGRHGPVDAFWHLQTSGVWLVERAKSLRPKRTDPLPSASELRRRGARGEVPKRYWSVVIEDEALRAELVARVLSQHWPVGIHDALRVRLGLDGTFDGEVRRAYDNACALCGHGARLDGEALGLTVTRLQWTAAGGPEELANALLLCVLHAHAFDRGALGLAPDGTVLVAEGLVGEGAAALKALAGRPIAPAPADVYGAWHRREVFRG